MPSLSIITTTNVLHDLHEFAVKKTMQNVPWDEVVWISDKQPKEIKNYRYYDISVVEEAYKNFYSLEKIQKFNIDQYSLFCLKGFFDFVRTSHVLIVQNDSMATNKQYWTDEYFDYDYIGPLTHISFSPVKDSLLKASDDIHKNKYEKLKKNNNHWWNGGGGFSLRSKKLLNILYNDSDLFNLIDYSCDDITISLILRQELEKKYDIKFAPEELCLRFCTELLCMQDNSEQKTLGFHGWYNAPLCLSEDECLFYFEKLENGVKMSYHISGYERVNFALNCLRRGYFRLMAYFIKIQKWPFYILPNDIDELKTYELFKNSKSYYDINTKIFMPNMFKLK